jgi:hypothetical protein
MPERKHYKVDVKLHLEVAGPFDYSQVSEEVVKHLDGVEETKPLAPVKTAKISGMQIERVL